MENKLLKKSLSPIVDKQSKILILGSLISDKSIIANEYYGNKTNQFCKIISLVFNNKEIIFDNYNEKITFLKLNHIALWDVYNLAQREGSLDSNIKNATFNDLKDLINNYPNIQQILVNGKKSQMGFEQYIKKEHIALNYKYIPSSSSANTKYSLYEKVQIWKEAIFF